MENTKGAAQAIVVDGNVPAGNVVVEGVDGDVVSLRQDMRDSADWFYWAFRVAGAEGRTLRFCFTDPYAGGPVSARGPAVTKDNGRSWSFAAESSAAPDGFTYTFAPEEREVWFYQTFQYFPWQWEEFLASHETDRGRLFQAGELCRSRKGRSVPKALFGNLGPNPKYSVFLSSRHHCGEAPATYVLEGFAGEALAPGELGDWLRANVAIMAVPFVDYDGVVDGDQGKGRRPHDHNRDYNDFIYPETKALAEWIGTRAGNDLAVFLDIHSPWVRNEYNERVYITYGPNEEMNAAKRRWGEILEREQDGALAYRVADNFPWNFGWNAPSNVAAGLRAAGSWAAATLRAPRLVSTYEVPFANANGKTVTPEACRSFGRASARTLRKFLEG